MKERVIRELKRIEQEYGVRVLLAVESGSRAWGFASPDSDYDVRFIYAHPKDWYISVMEERDVIEEMLPGDLDVSGWDLRKALRLFAKCNLALNEWIGSPMTYFAIDEFRAQIAALIPRYFNPIAAIHHYRSTAATAFRDNYGRRQEVPLRVEPRGIIEPFGWLMTELDENWANPGLGARLRGR